MGTLLKKSEKIKQKLQSQQQQPGQQRQPSQQEIYSKYIKERPDLINLSDEELQSVVDAYKNLSTDAPLLERKIDKEKLYEQIRDRSRQLWQQRQSDPRVQPQEGYTEKAAYRMADSIIRGEDPNVIAQQFGEDISNGESGRQGIGTAVARDLYNIFKPAVDQNQFTAETYGQKPDYSSNIKIAQDILAERGRVSSENAKVNAALSSYQDELNKSREEFFKSQRQGAVDYLSQDFAPGVAEQLGAIGLGDSGELGATVSSKYGDIMGTIDQAEIAQINEDVNFFANQAYQKTFSDLIAAKTGVSETIQTEREKALTTQSQGFQKRRAEIQNQFSLDQYAKASDKAYNSYITKKIMERDKAEDAQNAALTSSLAQTGLQAGLTGLIGLSLK